MNKVFYIIIILAAFLLLLSCSVRRNIPYKTYDFSERKEPVFWAGAPYRFNETEKSYLYFMARLNSNECRRPNISHFSEQFGRYFHLICPDGYIFHRATSRFLEDKFTLLYCFNNESERSNCNCTFYAYYPEGEEHFKNEFKKKFFCIQDSKSEG